MNQKNEGGFGTTLILLVVSNETMEAETLCFIVANR